MSKNQRIGGYIINYDKDLIGKGGQGTVFQGQQIRTKRKVAIKIIKKKIVNLSKSQEEQIQQQIKMVQSLKHPNIVQFIEYIKDDKNYYIIQQICDGDFRNTLKKGRIQENQSVKMLIQICCAFYAIRERKIIHRDLKPENILVKDNLLKVADFGLAKQVINSKKSNQQIVGTSSYKPLQILKQQKYTSKCDIWALGLIFYQMLHGESAWTGMRRLGEYQLVKTIQSNPLTIERTDLKPSTKDFLSKCLKPLEKDRISWNQVFSHQIFDGFFNLVEQVEFKHIPGERLKNLLQSFSLFPNLRIINYFYIRDNIAKQIKDYDIFSAIGNNSLKFPNLQIIIIGIPFGQDAEIKALFQKAEVFYNLKTIEINIGQITHLGLKSLAQNGYKFPNLENIILINNPNIGLGLKYLPQNSKHFFNLKTIKCTYSYLTDEGFIVLFRNASIFLNIKTIDFNGSNITDKGLDALAKNGSKFPNLQQINLQYNMITETGVKSLGQNSLNFLNLKNINLCHNKLKGMGIKEFTEKSSKLFNLQIIDFSQNDIKDEGLDALAKNCSKFPNLQYINLDGNMITDTGVKSLGQNSSKFLNLKQINLRHNKLKGIGIKEFADRSSKFFNLQIVDFSHNEITDIGIEALAKNDSKFSNLQKINLNNNKITGEELQKFVENSSNLLNLKQLNLDFNQINDFGLKVLGQNLSKFPCLEKIKLSYNKITDPAGVQNFLKNACNHANLKQVDLYHHEIKYKNMIDLKKYTQKLTIRM